MKVGIIAITENITINERYIEFKRNTNDKNIS